MFQRQAISRVFQIHRIGLVLIALVSTCPTFAQSNSFNRNSVGILASTNGLGFCGRTIIGEEKETNNHSLRIGLQMLRHHNEAKVQNTNYTAPKPYVFEKINSGATARIGYGFRNTFSNRAVEKPLLSLVFAGGPNIGFLKPYYVRFENPDDDQNNILIVQQDERTRKYQGNITGPANWTRGLNEIQTQMGIHTSISLDIEWIPSYSFKSWEIGCQMDYFFNDFKILNNRSSQSFVGLFTHYSFGNN